MTSKSYNLLTLIFLLMAGALFVFFLIYISDLRLTISNLESEKSALSLDKIAYEKSVGELKKQKNSLTGSNLISQGTLMGNADYIETVSNKVLKNRCRQTPSDLRSCKFFSDYGNILLKRSDAVSKRGMATSSQDYDQVFIAYESMLNSNETMQWNNDKDSYRSFKAGALEGQAYSRWKSNDIESATSIIKEAAQLAPGSALVNLTKLKIECAVGLPKENAVKQKAAFLARLVKREERERASGDIVAARNISWQSEYFSSDAELAEVCNI